MGVHERVGSHAGWPCTRAWSQRWHARMVSTRAAWRGCLVEASGDKWGGWLSGAGSFVTWRGGWLLHEHAWRAGLPDAGLFVACARHGASCA